jgi:hypothetical protein
MEYKLFSLKDAQKKGSANVSHAVDKIVNVLVAVLLVAVMAGTIFGYLGTGANGLGNATANPSAPTWLSPVLIIVVGITLLYLVLKSGGLSK